MDVDPAEEARFKAALARLSPQEIRRRLDNNSIMRDWKRDLAKGEVARRAQEVASGEAQTVRAADSVQRGKKQAAQQVWVLVAIAIVAAVTVIWFVVPR